MKNLYVHEIVLKEAIAFIKGLQVFNGEKEVAKGSRWLQLMLFY